MKKLSKKKLSKRTVWKIALAAVIAALAFSQFAYAAGFGERYCLGLMYGEGGAYLEREAYCSALDGAVDEGYLDADGRAYCLSVYDGRVERAYCLGLMCGADGAYLDRDDYAAALDGAVADGLLDETDKEYYLSVFDERTERAGLSRNCGMMRGGFGGGCCGR